jgi:hypothetical protein
MEQKPASWTTVTRHRHKLTRHPDVLKAYQDFKSQLAAKGQTLEEHVRATVFRGKDKKRERDSPVLVPNQFPYWTTPGIEHWVLWSPPSVGPLSAAAVRAAITEQRPAGAKAGTWFENPPAAKTVPGIWHVHVFLRAPL